METGANIDLERVLMQEQLVQQPLKEVQIRRE
jgi:hypothetical protein